MQNQTLIFIPDISGFTDFINNTAIDHSQHIISELLEIILQANILNFSISEIEGDAVLFYKTENIPSPDKLINQAREMFLRFHSHINEIDNTNVCQCGACRSASGLSLKFIAHIGEIKEIKVNNFNKLIGSDLILAHRLLKNSIVKKEYLLFSENYFGYFPLDTSKYEDWIFFESRHEEIDKFGQVHLKYINFKPLLTEIPKFIKENRPAVYHRKPDISIRINAPILLVHDKLTDANAKYDFVPGIKKIITDDKINRINSSHTCVFDDLEIHFVTKNNTVNKGNITYSEEAQLPQGLKFITDYRLLENGDKTDLEIFVFKSKLQPGEKEDLFKKMKDYFLLKFLTMKNRKGIKLFKEYCEKKYIESLNEGSI